MRKSILIAFVLILTGLMANAQFDEYKYVVVPIKFATFKNQNQFKTSTIIKYELAKQGFNVVYNNNLPEDLKKNRCLGLDLNLLDNSGMFATKTILTFSNCNGVEVYRTIEGKSKEKSFEIAYMQAIQVAVASMGSINYEYQEKVTESEPIVAEETVIIPVGNDVKQMEKETVTVNMANDIKHIAEEPKEETFIEEVDNSEVVAETVVQNTIKDERVQVEDTIQTLYAQSVGDGYQLVDTTPKVVYELTPTTLEDTFLVKGIDDGNGILHKKEGKWILEYDSKNGKVVRELNVKF